MAYSDDLAAHVEHEMEVARRRFRSRIAMLALASVVLDLVAAGLALAFEHGRTHTLRDLLRRALLDDDAAADRLVAAAQPRAHR